MFQQRERVISDIENGLTSRGGGHKKSERLGGGEYVLDLKYEKDVLSITEVIGCVNGNVIYNTLSIASDGIPTYTSKNLIGGQIIDNPLSEEAAKNEVSRLLKQAHETLQV